jgi:ABC-type lipoprotein release transport system permease subunit
VIALRVSNQLRAHGRGWLVWAVIVGVTAGIPLAALAGAHRTQTAYDRFLDATEAYDVLVANGGTSPTNLNRQFDFEAVAALPEVESAAVLGYYAPYGVRADGLPIDGNDLLPVALLDERFGRDFNTLPMVRGRMPETATEIALSPLAADILEVGVGDTLMMDLVAYPQAATDTVEDHRQPTGRFAVVGIVAVQGGFPPVTGGSPVPAFLDGSFAEANPGYAELLFVRLVPEAEPTAFVDRLQELGAPDQVVSTTQAEQAAPVQRGLDVQATALRVFALLAAVLSLLLAFQALGRRMTADAADDPVWQALGVTPVELRRSRMAIGALTAPVAAVAAALTAVALSPLFPVGVGRDLELDTGVRADGRYLIVGVFVVALTVVVLHVVAAAGQARADVVARRPRRPARLAPLLASTTVPTTAAMGMSMAVETGRGARTVPVRSTLVSIGIGIAAIVAVLVLSSSQQHLFDQPRLYGWAWDVQVGDAFAPALDDLADDLRADPRAEAVSLATFDRLTIGDQTFDAMAIDADSGIVPTTTDGTAPARPDEIMLGTRTARRLGLGVGDRLTARLGARSVDLTVSGIGVFPAAGTTGLGAGVELTLDGLAALTPEPVTDTVLVNVVPGPEGQALVEDLLVGQSSATYLPTQPSDLAALERLGGLPSVVALLLALVGLLGLLGALVTSVRRRRGRLATLKAVGFTRAQVAAVVLWQATTLTLVAVVVAVPIGIMAGRLLWLLFTERLGVPYEPTVPIGWVLALAGGSLGLAVAVAVGPAVQAARIRPGPALRAD